jgi:glycosyltransferase involved in cell wall biosynthesis
MKILFVTPYLPSPPRFGAQRRLDGLMRGLARHHEVSLISLCAGDDGEAEALKVTKEYCSRVITVPNRVIDLDTRKKRLMQLRSLASLKSFEYHLYHNREFQARLSALLEEGFDVVQVEFSHLGVYDFECQLAVRPLVILDEHNIEYEIVRRTAEAEGSIARRIYSDINWRKVRKEEVEAWRKVDGVVLTSARDESLLKESDASVLTEVVPNAVDLDHFRTQNVQRDASTLIFFGAMNYHPNIQGVTYFVEEILPKIAREVPDVRLQIVGQNPPASIRALEGKHVEVLGFVDDPCPLLDRAAAMVVPLQIGGGTRFKIVEGMAMSMPIVSTTIGAEGLDVEQERHLLIADDPEIFARQTIRVLKDPELGRQLGFRARLQAEGRYGWAHAVSVLEGFFAKCMDVRADASQAATK